MKEIIKTDKAPTPAGPYSPVVALGELLFISGQGAIDPATGAANLGELEQETRLTLDNVKNILEDVGSGLENVLKVTAYLSDMENFQAFNAIYAEYFPKNPPARTCIQAGRLPLDFKVEIDVIAYRSQD